MGIWRIKAQDRELRQPFIIQRSGTSSEKETSVSRVNSQELSLDTCSRMLSRKLKHQHVLAQHTIQLNKYEGMRFDLRVLVQRNRHNEWQVSSIICRLLSPDGMTCNLRQGGQMISASELLTTEERNSLKQASVQVSDTMGKVMRWKQPIAELGLDWGYTKNQQFRLIEVNAKPARPNFVTERIDQHAIFASENHLKLSDQQVPLSWKRWVDYCLHLGGF